MTRLQLKHWVWIALAAIVAVGFFLRSYHFDDWLHFELDQARDARVVDDGLRGDFWDLPLLGPKAGGTTLRLPPLFYYLEYGSARLFGGSPSGMAFLSMLLSVAALPVFYLLLRRYFRASLALMLTLLMAVSEFFVMYGRFSWNPNLIPFFLLLAFYALLRAVDEYDPKRERFFLVAVAALAMVTQFHFLAFVSVPVIAGLFFLIRRPKFSLKVWGAAVGIAAVLYFPMFLNELETGFANSQAFVEAVTKKSGKSDRTFIEKAIKDVSEHALYGMVVTTGFEGGTFPAIFVGTKGAALNWACDSRCDEGKWYGVAAAGVFVLSLLALIGAWWRETDRKRRDFLTLVGIWIGITFVLYLPLAYDMAPRFFLVSGPTFLILLGILLTCLTRLLMGHRYAQLTVLIVGGLFVLMNLVSLSTRFQEIDRSLTEAVNSPPDRILKERIRVPLNLQYRIVDFLAQRSEDTGYPLYMWSEPQHRRALKYLLEKRGVTNEVLGTEGIYREGLYYLILRAQSDLDDALLKYRASYTVGKATPFGTLVALELIPKPEAVTGVRQDFSRIKPNDSQGLPRYTWREYFSRRQHQPESDEDEQEDDSINE